MPAGSGQHAEGDGPQHRLPLAARRPPLDDRQRHAVADDRVEDGDRLGPHHRPPGRRHVDHHRRPGRVEQHVADEVGVDQLVGAERGVVEHGGEDVAERARRAGRLGEGGALGDRPPVGAGVQLLGSHRHGRGELGVQQPPGGQGDLEVAAHHRPGLVPRRPPPVDDPPAVAGRHRHRQAQVAAPASGRLVEPHREPRQHRVEPQRRRLVTARRQHQVARPHAAAPSARQRRDVVGHREQVEHLGGRAGHRPTVTRARGGRGGRSRPSRDPASHMAALTTPSRLGGLVTVASATSSTPTPWWSRRPVTAVSRPGESHGCSHHAVPARWSRDGC